MKEAEINQSYGVEKTMHIAPLRLRCTTFWRELLCSCVLRCEEGLGCALVLPSSQTRGWAEPAKLRRDLIGTVLYRCRTRIFPLIIMVWYVMLSRTRGMMHAALQHFVGGGENYGENHPGSKLSPVHRAKIHMPPL